MGGVFLLRPLILVQLEDMTSMLPGVSQSHPVPACPPRLGWAGSSWGQLEGCVGRAQQLLLYWVSVSAQLSSLWVSQSPLAQTSM